MKYWIGIISVALLLSFGSTTHAETPDELYAKADQLYDAEDYDAAKAILLPLAQNGHAKAMNRIGYMHSKGLGFKPNRTLACDWYEKSAHAGYASGQHNLSLCFDSGKGRKHCDESSVFWMTKAAEQGRTDSQIDLILYYAPNNKAKAAEWGQRAIDQGSVVARVVMAAWDLPYQGPPPLITDQLCAIVLIGYLEMPRSTCEPN